LELTVDGNAVKHFFACYSAGIQEKTGTISGVVFSDCNAISGAITNVDRLSNTSRAGQRRRYLWPNG
jgi:hypothetical protein